MGWLGMGEKLNSALYVLSSPVAHVLLVLVLIQCTLNESISHGELASTLVWSLDLFEQDLFLVAILSSKNVRFE
jgi:hypothetical protein